MDKVKAKHFLLVLLRPLLCALIYVWSSEAISAATSVSIFWEAFPILSAAVSVSVFWDAFPILKFPFAVLVKVLMLGSFIRIFYYNDVKKRTEFLSRTEKAPTFRSEFRDVLFSRELRIELVFLVLCRLLSPMFVFEASVKEILSLSLSLYTVRLLLVPAILVLYAGQEVLTRISARKYWFSIRGLKEARIKREIRKTVKDVFFALFVYFGTLYALPYLFMAVMIVYEFAVKFRVAILVFIALVIFWRTIRAFFKRRSFIKKLKKLCKKEGYTLSKIERPYAEVFFPHGGMNFTVGAHGKEYDCKFLAAKAKGAFMIFFAGGEGVFERVFRLRELEFFKLHKPFYYDFESDKRKVLILTPVPKKTFIADHSKLRPVDNGEIIWDYKLFSGYGFLGALERDCIDITDMRR